MPPSALHLRALRYHLQGAGPKIWMQQVISKADHFDLVSTSSKTASTTWFALRM